MTPGCCPRERLASSPGTRWRTWIPSRSPSMGEAIAAGAAKEPTLFVDPHGTTKATFNDEALMRRLSNVLAKALGPASLDDYTRSMGSEDFSEYGHAGVPAAFLWIGATAPAKL